MPATVTATEIKNSFGKYLDVSQREPVLIEKSGRSVAVLLSREDYESLQSASLKAGWGGSDSKNGVAFEKDIRFGDDNAEWMKALNGIESLSHLSTNAEKNDAPYIPVPSRFVLDHALRLLVSLYTSACRRGQRWVAPHVGVNEEGKVTLEWWQGQRDMTLYIDDLGVITYLKSWGSNIHDEMADGVIVSLEDVTQLSRWLYEK
jgi:antitoxin Phd